MPVRVLIVGGGASPGDRLLRQWAQRFDGVIAADSGLDTLLAAGLEPDYLTGDLDSVSAEARQRFPEDRQLHDSDQETTDLEKAIRMAIDLSAAQIGLACVTGSRLDHSLNAISMILRYHDRADFVLLDSAGEARLILPPGIELTDPVGARVSLVPAPEAGNIRTTNLRYPLSGSDLRLGGRDGISNEITAAPARIDFDSGALLIYRQTGSTG